MAIHPSALLTTGPAQSTPAIRTGSVRLVVPRHRFSILFNMLKTIGLGVGLPASTRRVL